MSFCTRCGASIAGNFCTSCGTRVGETGAPAGQPAQAPSTPVPAEPAPPAAPAAKKRGPLFFVLVGCGGLIGIGLILVIAGGLFVAHKAKQAGLDPELARRNPALAAAKMMVAVNPELELVNSDENRGTVTIREKKTGKTVTVNLDDIKRGHIVFESDNGERVDIQGSEGGARIKTNDGTMQIGEAKLPSWVPGYPGAKVEGGLSSDTSGEENGTASLKTGDSVEQVAAFYEQKFKDAGMTVERLAGDNSVTISGENASAHRTAAAIIARAGSETTVSLTFESKK